MAVEVDEKDLLRDHVEQDAADDEPGATVGVKGDQDHRNEEGEGEDHVGGIAVRHEGQDQSGTDRAECEVARCEDMATIDGNDDGGDDEAQQFRQVAHAADEIDGEGTAVFDDRGYLDLRQVVFDVDDIGM